MPESHNTSPPPPAPPLWIAIRLPLLALEVFLRGAPTPNPLAVAGVGTRAGEIIACDAKARARGVHAGLSEPAALALVPQLLIRPQDRAAETEALLGVAAWAAQITPAVVLDFPATVLIEVSGSLLLAGGLGRILNRLKEGMSELGFTATLACAPTARAAGWLALAPPAYSGSSASSGPAPIITSTRHAGPALDAALATLPLSVLEQAAGRAHEFEAIGVFTLGELLTLPREGVGRRFGQALLDEIDRGYGRLPDPRGFFQPPEKFHAELEFPSEVTSADALLFAARRLFVQLEGHLAARAAGVQRIAVKLAHRDARTEIILGLVSPSRDARHFTLLLRERLTHTPLSGAVRALAIVAEDLRPLTGTNASLFPDAAAEAGNWNRLVEQLRARLGHQAVQGLVMGADHRPEAASIATTDIGMRTASAPAAKRRTAVPVPAAATNDAGEAQLQLALANAPEAASSLPLGERPFWLLAAPRPIAEASAETGVKTHGGNPPLQILAGPERIESGWWDGADVARDYFIVRSASQGGLLWVYRERPRGEHSPGWYVHGVFA